MASKKLTPQNQALGRLIAADPEACAALNEVYRILRAFRMQREAANA